MLEPSAGQIGDTSAPERTALLRGGELSTCAHLTRRGTARTPASRPSGRAEADGSLLRRARRGALAFLRVHAEAVYADAHRRPAPRRPRRGARLRRGRSFPRPRADARADGGRAGAGSPTRRASRSRRACSSRSCSPRRAAGRTSSGRCCARRRRRSRASTSSGRPASPISAGRISSAAAELRISRSGTTAT